MELRSYQKSAAESVVNWLRYKDEPAIVVIPTGGGKSLVIKSLAEHFSRLVMRVLILAHRKELLEQTGEKIVGDVGYYSASIGEKRLDAAITIANIQSISRAQELPKFDVILVDECHMLSNDTEDDSMYWKLIKRLNGAKLAGFTATPYRLRGGRLDWGEIVYDISYAALLDAGYLCPLSNKLLADCAPPLESVDVKLGDYVLSQLEDVMEDPELLRVSVQAISAYSTGRSSCIIFTVSLKHASLLLSVMHDSGVDGGVIISSETPVAEREQIVADFKNGNIRYLINCELLLIGFDAPRVDAIFCLRPTKSKGLWEQLCGRGVRLFDGKKNCLLIDMAGNLKEHGPLGGFSDRGPSKSGVGVGGKVCPECEEYVSPIARECKDCGYIFPEAEIAKISHAYEADTESAVLAGDICTYTVSDVQYKEHKGKNGKPNTLRIDYICGYGKYGSISEWFSVAAEANEWARDKAQAMFKDRGHELTSPIQTYSMDDLLWHAMSLKKPHKITVDHSGNFPRIIRFDWERPPEQIDYEKILDDEIGF